MDERRAMGVIYFSFSKALQMEPGRTNGFLPIYLSFHPQHCVLPWVPERCGRESAGLEGHTSYLNTGDKGNTPRVCMGGHNRHKVKWERFTLGVERNVLPMRALEPWLQQFPNPDWSKPWESWSDVRVDVLEAQDHLSSDYRPAEEIPSLT